MLQHVYNQYHIHAISQNSSDNLVYDQHKNSCFQYHSIQHIELQVHLLSQNLAMRTNDGLGTERLLDMADNLEQGLTDAMPETDIDLGGLINGLFGLSGESGEFIDMIKKWIFHEKELDEDHAKKELGDVMWYVAMICESFGWSLDEIMQMNIDKLKKRYPEGFDTERANNRKPEDV